MPAADEPISVFLDASVIGHEAGRIRRLKGFLKGGHFEPESHSPNADAFVRKAGSPDVEARAEVLFKQLRTAFAYKRKELVYSCDGGLASIKTPDFEVTLSVGQCSEDPRNYDLMTSVGAFKRPEVVTEEAFIAVFRYHCDTVLVEFPTAIDVAARIDALEENSKLDGFLDYPADASSLTVRIPGASVQLELSAHSVRFSLDSGGDLRQLIAGTIKLMHEFSNSGTKLLLPNSA